MFHTTVHSGGTCSHSVGFSGPAYECVEADEGTDTDTDHKITPAKAHPRHEGQVLKAGWP
jgi:hypothetical protein